VNGCTSQFSEEQATYLAKHVNERIETSLRHCYCFDNNSMAEPLALYGHVECQVRNLKWRSVWLENHDLCSLVAQVLLK